MFLCKKDWRSLVGVQFVPTRAKCSPLHPQVCVQVGTPTTIININHQSYYMDYESPYVLEFPANFCLIWVFYYELGHEPMNQSVLWAFEKVDIDCK